MDIYQKIDVITIMERTLNYIDMRLTNHGRRVAYIVYQLLWPTGRYTQREMRDICIAAVLHDIGAYKTEEIDQMVSFETENTLDHSIYGYLFFKYFSPLEHLSYAILHHHTKYAQLDFSHPLAELAQIFFIADRIDVLMLSGFRQKKEIFQMLDRQRGNSLSPEVLDFVMVSDVVLPVTDQDVMDHSTIHRVLHSIPLTDGEIQGYLKTIVMFIDFRSHQTFTHTLSTASVSDSLAKLMHVDHESRINLVVGSWLHDIGKTGVPLKVLEKPDALTDTEMQTIQTHVNITDKILTGTVPDKVRHIAAHHHEKLNGTGYPDGLGARELPICERIAVVADIFSALCGVRSYKDEFPKEQVVSILNDMAAQGLVDAAVVDTAVLHYDEIKQQTVEAVRPFQERFEAIRVEFSELKTLAEAVD